MSGYLCWVSGAQGQPRRRAPVFRGGRRSAVPLWGVERINPLGQIERRTQIAQLGHGQRDFLHAVGPWVVLLDGDAFLKSVDDHVLLQGGGGVVHKRDDGRVEFMFNRKHAISLPTWQVFATMLILP